MVVDWVFMIMRIHGNKHSVFKPRRYSPVRCKHDAHPVTTKVGLEERVYYLIGDYDKTSTKAKHR